MVDQSWVSTVARARKIRVVLAGNVRRERERAGLSQEALADACLVRRGTIARICVHGFDGKAPAGACLVCILLDT